MHRELRVKMGLPFQGARDFSSGVAGVRKDSTMLTFSRDCFDL